MSKYTRKFSFFLAQFSSGTMISRLTGFAREVAMATLFGVSATVAGFWMAFRFAHLLRRFFGEGALHVSFVPHFVALKEKDSAKAAHFLYELSLLLTLFLLFVVVVAELVLGGCVLFASISRETQQVLLLTMTLLPALVFICLYALNSAFLHSQNNYFLSSIAPALVNFVWIGGAFFFANELAFVALQKLSMLIVVGFALQYIVTLPRLLRFFSGQPKYDKSQALQIRREILTLLLPFFFAILGVCATQVNSLLDALFARAADPSGPAYLWYAIRLQQLPLALFGVGIASVLLPHLSKKSERGDKELSINFALKKSITLMVPITAAFLVMGLAMITFVYGHGKFSSDAIIHSTYCLYLYALALVPMTLVLVLAPWFYAKKETKLPAFCAFVSVGLNVLLNAFFVYRLQLGAGSIALATSISACANVGLLLFFIARDGGSVLGGVGKVFAKTICCSVVAMAAAWQMGLFLGDQTSVLLADGVPILPTHFLTQFQLFALPATIFSAAFILMAYLLRLKEFTELLQMSKARA